MIWCRLRINPRVIISVEVCRVQGTVMELHVEYAHIYRSESDELAIVILIYVV
jgi:hypothetical protein